ncbi:MAG: transposase, partial [Thaumarchaeota archaeon]|nr:transposase [Nitrososphaerota archaeon]
RTHICNLCGLSLDRDLNAAVNILKKVNELPGEPREVTPVEMTQ